MPLLMDLSIQSQQLVREKKAKQLLFEELHANLIDGRSNSSYSIVHNGTQYNIYWILSEDSGQKEVCVKVDENSFIRRTEICSVPE
jgi:competence protein ComGE